MSDQSSESSGEWVVLNENDTNLSLENLEQSLSVQLNYNAVCNAVSDSIRSSFSSEELEWQYEQFEEFIPTYSPSYIEDLDPKELDVESAENSNVSQAEDDDISKCAFINEDVNLASIPKIRCYKHNRNDHLNFVLNLMLALVVSSAIGLGIGHFLGWSHKCYTKVTKAAASDNLPDLIKIKQSMSYALGEPEKQVIIPQLFSENLSYSSPCLNSNDGSISAYQEIYNVQLNNSTAINAVLPETSGFLRSDGLELKSQEKNSNFSDSGLSHVSNIITQWNKIPNDKVSVQNEFSDSNVIFPVKINDDFFYEKEVKHVKFELPNEFYIKDKGSFKELKDFHNTEKMPSANTDNLFHEGDIKNAEFELLKQFYIKDTNFHEEKIFTNQLRHDLNQVVESLSTIILKRLTDFQEKYTTPVEDSKMIIKLYSDFQNLVNTKITDMESFVLSAGYKTYPKPSLKYLRKMIYTLVDSVDYLMNVSFKPLSRQNKKINVHKLSNNISKVIFNFNKKWEKNSKIWAEILEKFRISELSERSFKKENKQWKKKAQFEKGNIRNNKFRKYSLKS